MGGCRPVESMVNLKQTYQGKKVFITGHTGFKGSWLVNWLVELGAVVKGYSLTPKRDEDLFNIGKVSELCDSLVGDIRDGKNLEQEILNFEPDFIFHLAAQPIAITNVP